MKDIKNKKILVILGQTATGKSDLAVKLAKKYNGEVISADSRQVYKGLDIGTGKITKKEMRGIHHWLLDVTSPKKTFTVADYKKLAEQKINTILKRNKLPIICGGTGFYIDSVVKNVVLPEVKPNLKLRKELGEKSLEELQNILKKLDSNRYKNIDLNNPVRLVRAIEIAKELGSVPSLVKTNSPFEILQIGIKVPDEDLKKNINKRVVSRIKKGMIEEAEKLHKNGLSYERMEELGLEYRLLSKLIQKKINKKDFVDKLQKEIWQYARRQMVWFKKDNRIKWFSPKELPKIKKVINSFLD